MQRNATNEFDNQPTNPSRTGVSGTRRSAYLAAALLALTTVACGSASEFDEIEGVESREDRLINMNAGVSVWKYLTPMQALPNATGDGAMCSQPSLEHMKITFSRDTTGYIHGRAENIAGGDWGRYGGAAATRKFGGDPACGLLGGSSGPYPFVIVAKGSKAPTNQGGGDDKRLYWSKGSWDTSPAAPPPASATQWAALGNTQYNVNGNPGVGTRDSQAVVAYLNDSGQLKANYWTGTTFSATLNGPSMPAGWVAKGTPAVVYVEGWLQKFMIVVRAVNSAGTARLYLTYFGADNFKDAAGGSQISFSHLVLPATAPAVDGDPALEFDPELYGTTLYYRQNKKIYQMSASVNDFSTSTVQSVTIGNSTPSFSGNPSVVGGVPMESGKHWIVVRGDGADTNLYFGEAYNDFNLSLN